MENPYQSPDPNVAPEGGQIAADVAEQPASRLVGHVRVVAILLLIEAGLELVMGLFLLVMTVVFPMIISGAAAANEGKAEAVLEDELPVNTSPDSALIFVTVTYGLLAAAAMVSGGLRIWAGVKNLRYRSRTLGVVSLSVGLLMVMTCYCSLTAVPLFVYGLVVYLNGDVARAFELGEQGHSVDEIHRLLRVP